MTTQVDKIINVNIQDKNELYRSYMPFLKHGGLFVATEENFVIGEEIVLDTLLPECRESKQLRTTVAWINDKTSSSGQLRGVGLAFGSDQTGIETKQIIEDLLPGLKLSDSRTYTL